jgi:hypothetical protein
MSKKNLIQFGALGLVFALANLTFRQVTQIEGIAFHGAFAIVSSLFAFWWSFRFIAGKPERQQVLYTSVLCGVFLGVIFLRVKTSTPDRQPALETRGADVFFVDTLMSEPDTMKQRIAGKWIYPRQGGDMSFEFVSADSVVTQIGGQMELHFLYHIKKPMRLLVIEQDRQVKFDWHILKLDQDSLVVGDGRTGLIRFVNADNLHK